MFPEHGSRFEIISVQIGDLTFRYYEVSGVGFPNWLGQLTFAIEPGTSVEDVVVQSRTTWYANPRTGALKGQNAACLCGD